MSNVLVVAEHLHGKFPKTTLVGAHRRQEPWPRRRAARPSASSSARTSTRWRTSSPSYGIDVVAVDGPQFEHYVADAYTAAIADVAKQKDAEDVVATATALGKDLLPRLAARLDAGMASDISAIVDAHDVPCARCGPATCSPPSRSRPRRA